MDIHEIEFLAVWLGSVIGIVFLIIWLWREDRRDGILRGKAARRFECITKENEGIRASKEEYERLKANYKKFKDSLSSPGEEV